MRWLNQQLVEIVAYFVFMGVALGPPLAGRLLCTKFFATNEARKARSIEHRIAATVCALIGFAFSIWIFVNWHAIGREMLRERY